MERQTITVEEFAQAVGLAPVSVYRTVKRGEIPSIRIGRRFMIPRTALERLLGEPVQPASSEAAKGELAHAG